MSLPPSVHPPEALMGRRTRDDRWFALLGAAICPQDFGFHELREKSKCVGRLVARLVHLQSPATSLVLLHLCLHTHGKPRDGLYHPAQIMQSSSMKRLEVRIFQEAWLHAKVSIQKRGSSIRGVQAAQPAPRVTCPASATPILLDTLMLHASQGDRISLDFLQAPGAAGLWRVLTPPNSAF